MKNPVYGLASGPRAAKKNNYREVSVDRNTATDFARRRADIHSRSSVVNPENRKNQEGREHSHRNTDSKLGPGGKACRKPTKTAKTPENL